MSNAAASNVAIAETSPVERRMNPRLVFRVRFAMLWLSQSLHFLANYGLRMLVVLHLAKIGGTERDAAWHLGSAVFMAPSIFLVPLYGALSNSLPKRWALVASAGYCAAVTLILAGVQQGWLFGLGFVALGSALYTPTRFALLPAAATDTDWPLQRLTSFIEAGCILSMVTGMVVAGKLFDRSWSDVGLAAMTGIATPDMAVLVVAQLVSFALVLPVVFPSDVRRPESLQVALAGFVRDAGRVFRMPMTCGTLLAIAALRSIVTAAAGAFIANALAGPGADAWGSLMWIAIVSILGTAFGSLVAGLPKGHTRALVLIPLGATGMSAAMIWAAAAPPVPLWICFVVGACGGLVNVPLLTAYQEHLPADARGNGMAILGTAGFLGMTLISAVLATIVKLGWLGLGGQLWVVATLTCLGAAMAWIGFVHLVQPKSTSPV
jgi:hypothetical protein